MGRLCKQAPKRCHIGVDMTPEWCYIYVMRSTTTNNQTINKGDRMYRIYWINHDYYAVKEFETCADAVKYGKSKAMHFVIYCDNDIVYSKTTL